jgi:hypothetical protein
VEKIMAIYDSDLIYTTRFMEYFKKKNDFSFEISAFTKKECLEEFLQLHQIDILLIGGQALQQDLSIEKIKYIYQFTDDPNEEKDAEKPTIFKYQSAQAVMAEIMFDYNKKQIQNQVKINSKMTKIISVYAPVPSAEKLAFAWSISTLLSEQKKVLFVPLELLPIQLLSFIDRTNEYLSEFIYYLKENPSIIMNMKNLLGHNGNLSYLTGLAHGFDILSLDKEDIRRWEEEIKLHTDYQTIVFYLGCYTEAIIEIINRSDSVLLPTLDNPYEIATLQEWERQSERIGINANHDKFIRIKLQEEEAFGKETITLQELTNSRAFYVANNFVNS